MTAETKTSKQPAEAVPPPLPPSARNDPEANRVMEALTRAAGHAVPVGEGIHRQHVSPPKPGAPAPEEVKFGHGWSPHASLKGQVERGPDYWKTDRIEVKVFDLADATQLAAYNTTLTQSNVPDTNVVLMKNEQKFCEQTGNWKALVELQYILYRKVLITDKNKDEQASGD